MLDFDPQSPDHTSVTFTEPNRFCAPISKVCQGAKTIFFSARIGAMAALCSRYLRFPFWRYLLLLLGRCGGVLEVAIFLNGPYFIGNLLMIFFTEGITAPANAGEASHSRGAHVVPPFQRLGAATDSDGL